MGSLFQRWVDDECQQLFSQGLIPSAELISSRLRDLVDAKELAQWILSWRKRRGDLHAQALRDLGCSESLVKVFAR